MSKTRNIDAIELALATYFYASASHYDDDLREFEKSGGQIPDLGNKDGGVPAQVASKMEIPEFEMQHEAVSTKSVIVWYAADKGILRSVQNSLFEMSENPLSCRGRF